MVGFGVWVIGRGWVVGSVFGSWVTVWVSGGCGLWIGVVVGCGLWVVNRRGWVVVVDRRVGMKRVVGRGLAAEGGRWSWIGR